MAKPLHVRTEAWLRGSHSFALVYRFQLQALLKESDLRIHHQEQPPLHPGQHDGVDAGFSLGSLEQVEALLVAPSYPPDVIYRLVSPSKLACSTSERLVCYLVTELGLGITRLADDGNDIQRFEALGGMIHTPSRWSKQRLIHGGFKPEHIAVIPNGVNPGIYFPMASEDIEAVRAQQGFTPEDIVLLNVGSPVWNKGLDILVQCFARLRQTNRRLHLVLKDQSSVYGVGVQSYVQEILKPFSHDMKEIALSGIRVIPAFLTFHAMRSVMNAADFYISPYRAEGFNMPVLEAIACGTRPIVSAIGSTSDFCHADNAFLIDGTLHGPMKVQDRETDAHFEPNPDALFANLQALCQSDPRGRKLPLVEREKSVSQFHWGVAAKALGALFKDMAASQ